MELFSFTNFGMRRKVFLNYLESCNRTLPKSQDIKNRKLFRLYMAFAMSVGCFRVCVIRLLIRTCYSSLLFLQATSYSFKANPLTFLGLRSNFESLAMRGLYSITRLQRIDVKNSAYIYKGDTTLQIFVEEALVQLYSVFWYVDKRQIN